MEAGGKRGASSFCTTHNGGNEIFVSPGNGMGHSWAASVARKKRGEKGVKSDLSIHLFSRSRELHEFGFCVYFGFRVEGWVLQVHACALGPGP